MGVNTTTPKEQEQEQNQQQYILTSASTLAYGGNTKLHWVIGEKQKKDELILKSNPAYSLCGIETSRFSDSFVEYANPEEFFEEQKAYFETH
jgi:hypothetical protein